MERRCGPRLHGEHATCEFVAELLVDSGLWEEVPGGYRVHDYLDYNPSRDKVLAERKEWADKKARYRRSNGVSGGESRRESAGDSGASPSRPVPVPVPERRIPGLPPL